MHYNVLHPEVENKKIIWKKKKYKQPVLTIHSCKNKSHKSKKFIMKFQNQKTHHFKEQEAIGKNQPTWKNHVKRYHEKRLKHLLKNPSSLNLQLKINTQEK